MSPRLTSRDRLARLLSVIPWVADQDDGALLDDVVTRFAYPRAQLLDDLQEVVFFVGVHPFSPDSLIEVEISDDRVHIRYADWFSRPLRLTAEEGARLLTAGRSVLQLAEGDPDDAERDANPDAADETGAEGQASPLLRALTKLGTALGEGAERAVDVRLGNAPDDTLAVLRQAVADGVRVDLEYYTYGRDELTERTVDPSRVFSDQGNWYLSGWCHRAEGERVFRVDRIRQANRTEQEASKATTASDASFSPSGDDPRVQLRLAPRARWVVEQYPVDHLADEGDHIDVRMAVTATPWLERLLLRLGPDATIESCDEPLSPDVRAVAARRVLARYQGQPA